MTRYLTMKTAYAAALMLAAASGLMIAMAGQAYAQSEPAAVKANAAKSAVTLSSKAMIERVETDANGAEKTVLKTPSDVIVVPGDKVVFTLSYVNESAEPAASFRATNPMPGPIQFLSAAEDWALVSVDGGKTWGKLSALTVTERTEEAALTDPETGEITQEAVSTEEQRAARAEDVTHVRWAFADDIAPGASGSVSYRGLVK